MKSVDAKTLKQWLDNEEAILIDVREPSEHAAKKIAEARLCPLGKINKSNLNLPKGKKIVLHCKLGRRGSLGCQKLLQQHPELQIYNLKGGIEAWEEAGFDTQKTETKTLPLDQQVQLTIGIFVLIASALAYWVSPLFNLVTGFFGAGLIYAGLSGTCRMAELIAKMPWNQKEG